jgi:hypothetical protein
LSQDSAICKELGLFTRITVANVVATSRARALHEEVDGGCGFDISEPCMSGRSVE